MNGLNAKHNPYQSRNAVNLVTITVGEETGGNTINVSMQFKDAAGKDVQEVVSVYMFLSDSATDPTIIATAHSTGVSIGTDGAIHALIANKAWRAFTESDGDLDINIVEAGAKTSYLWVVMPDGSSVVSGAITFA